MRILCEIHPEIDYKHHWGCPECLRELKAEKVELLAEKKQLQDELDKYKSAIIEVGRRAEIIKKALKE